MADFYRHEDGTELQKLTDAQVAARLHAYNEDGVLERDLRALWEVAGDLLESIVAGRFSREASIQLRERCTRPIDAGWVQAVAAFGIDIYVGRKSVPTVIDKRAPRFQGR